MTTRAYAGQAASVFQLSDAYALLAVQILHADVETSWDSVTDELTAAGWSIDMDPAYVMGSVEIYLAYR